MPSTASSSTRAIKQGKSKTTLAPIEKQRKKEERNLNHQFVALHNGMVNTINIECERYQKVHAEEVADRTNEYNAYLGLMRSCAMRHLGGTKTAPRYLKYLEEVGAAFSQHKKANPKKTRNKRFHAFKHMATHEDEEGEEEAEDMASETLEQEEVAWEEDEGDEEEEEEVAPTTSSEESDEESDDALHEPVRLPAKTEPIRLHPKPEQVRAAPKKEKVRAAPKTDQVRVVAPKLTLTLKPK